MLIERNDFVLRNSIFRKYAWSLGSSLICLWMRLKSWNFSKGDCYLTLILISSADRISAHVRCRLPLRSSSWWLGPLEWRRDYSFVLRGRKDLVSWKFSYQPYEICEFNEEFLLTLELFEVVNHHQYWLRNHLASKFHSHKHIFSKVRFIFQYSPQWSTDLEQDYGMDTVGQVPSVSGVPSMQPGMQMNMNGMNQQGSLGMSHSSNFLGSNSTMFNTFLKNPYAQAQVSNRSFVRKNCFI